MKTIRPTAVLFYYDGIQVFEGVDSIGGHYIGLLVKAGAGLDQYLVVGVAPARLWAFKTGVIDLRALLSEREESQFFLATPTSQYPAPMELLVQDGTLAETNWLPDPGFFLHFTPTESAAVVESRGRNNLVIDLAINPPESAHDHRIHAETLGRLLLGFQPLLKHAYSWAYRELQPSAQRVIERSTAPLVDVVVPAAPGSFRILLEATAGPGLFGQSELARALDRLDYLLERVNDAQETLARVQKYRGHFAGAYLRFMKLLQNSQSGLHYSWAEPDFLEPKTRSVSSAEAASVVAALETVANLGTETTHLIGALKKADVDNGTWRLETEERELAGKTKDGGPSLAGLRIDARYHFTCEEVLEETEGTGKEHRILYLLAHEPADPSA